MTADLEQLVRRALASGNPQAIALAYQLATDPASYRDDPVGYARNVLGVNLWEKQAEIARALVEHKRVMVLSANCIGKSFTVAVLANWFHQTRKGICCVTAPTMRQVRDVTFKEIRRLYKGPGLFPKLPRIEQSPDHYVYGFTADDATSFQGIHGENLFVIFEECVGVDATIWEAADGVLAGGNTYFLAVCNPTDTASEAYRQMESGRWHTISISAFDHPNIALELAGLPPGITGAIRLQQLRENIAQWCDPINLELIDKLPTDFTFEGKCWRPGPIAEARLLGRYPSQGSYSIFNEHDFSRTLTPQEPEGEVEIGCDVARFGDDNTCITVIQGKTLLHHESYNKRDTKHTAGRLKELADRFAGVDAKKIAIRVDSAGIGGGLCDQKDDYNFVEINSANKAHEETLYPNKRSELLFTVAELMKHGQIDFSRLPRSTFNEIRRQALGITYKLDFKGRRVAEKKEDIKKRIGRSPDDLDAIALAYCGRSQLANLGEFIDKITHHPLTTKDYVERLKAEQEANKKFKDKFSGDNDMAAAVFETYKQVYLLNGYGTYQARPLINQAEVPLGDYREQHEAAWAVQHTHKLLGTSSPHSVQPGKVKPERAKYVEQDTEEKLRKRNLWPKPEPKVEKKKEVK